MGLGEGCAMCCSIYSLLGIVLLLLFGGMFQQGAITFELISRKEGWDPKDKAKACFTAAILYGITFGISVLSKLYLSRSKK